MRFHSLLNEGLVRVEALDGLKPAFFDMDPVLFPWKDFAIFLVQAWQLSRPVPWAFRPSRRIPPEILDVLASPSLHHREALEILKTLRKNQFLPAVRQESRTKVG